MNKIVLHINASARTSGSLTRKMTEKMLTKLANKENIKVINRDLNNSLPFIDEQWVNANFTATEDRTELDRQKLSLSDTLVKELQMADTIIIGSPIYNFSIAASLKAWIDMVARAGVTFKYTDKGPVGLLQNKKVYIAVASGGVKVGSEYDFSYAYLKHVLAFIGLNDVTIVDVNAFDLSLNDADVEKKLDKVLS